jgi:hypothetical protein
MSDFSLKIGLNVFTSCCYSLTDALMGTELRGTKKVGEASNVVVQEYYVTLYNIQQYLLCEICNKFIIFSIVYLNCNCDTNSTSKHNTNSTLKHNTNSTSKHNMFSGFSVTFMCFDYVK